MRFIGDVHGKFGQYENLIQGLDQSIQVGDFGIGFGTPPDMAAGHRFIRGNHDNPDLCRVHRNWIPDGTVEGDIMFIGGGFSIDWEDRTLGIDWWDDEQLSYFMLDHLIEKAADVKPRIIVSHEAPAHVVAQLFSRNGRKYFYPPSRTSTALAAIYDLHKPEFHIFGHWHLTVQQSIDGTRFICLGELDFLDL